VVSKRPAWQIKPISAEALQQCFRDNLPRFEMPDIDRCEFWAEYFNERAEWTKPSAESEIAKKHARLFLKHLPPVSDEITKAAERSIRDWLRLQGPKMDWQGVASLIAATAMNVCQATTGSEPAYRNPGAPLCNFTRSVLGQMGTSPSDRQVADALRHRTGRNRNAK
jgi:hypothetical protein